MGQYFLCVVCSSIVTLSTCPGDKGGVDLNSTSIDTEDTSWILWMFECFYLLRKSSNKTKEKKKNKSFIISKYMRHAISFTPAALLAMGLPISWVTHSLEDGCMCVGFPVFELSLLFSCWSWSRHSASRSYGFDMLSGSIYVTCLRLDTTEEVHVSCFTRRWNWRFCWVFPMWCSKGICEIYSEKISV